MAQLKNTTVSDTGFLQLPVGTTAQRPTPQNGQMRFNTSTGKAEFYNATAGAWLGTAAAGVIATGGTVYDVDAEGTTYRVHVFTDTGNSTFTVSQGGEVEYLIVAGGGSSGGNLYHNGGGGAGGLLTGTTSVTSQAYTVTVGEGGAPGSTQQRGNQGQNSSAFSLTAIGGGSGGNYFDLTGGSGGSGGGAGGRNGNNATGGSGTAGQGNNGGNANQNNAGGGGGAGGSGENGSDAGNFGGDGGIGVISFIAGAATFYAGGGGAANYSTETPGTGGLGGGGNGNNTTGNPGTPNTGGGGGGCERDSSTNLGAGGSGIVIIRYPLRQENPVSAPGKVIGDGLVLDLDFAKPTVYSGSGTVVTDSRLNGVTGSFVGNLNYVNPRSNRASLDYTASPYVNFGTSVNNLGLSVATIETVFKSGRTDGGFSLIAGWGNGTSYYSSIGIGNWFGGTPDESVHVGINTGSTAGADQFTMFVQEGHAAYQDGNYHHIVAILAQNNYAIWIDGVQKTITFPNGIGQSASYSNIFGFDSSTTFELGRRPYGNGNFTGEINVFRLYNRILSNDEISNAFNTVRWRFGI